MSAVIEPSIITPMRHAQDFQAAEIARDLALMDALEAFVQSLPKRSEGHPPTTQEIRELAYEDGEVNNL